LTDFQKQLINALQNGLPICERPYAEIATILRTSEQQILQQTAELKKTGIIRRIRAMINYRALGFASTLVAVHVPESQLDAVAEAVNTLDGVSHNYLREHQYNMWFTLQEPSESQIEATLANLASRFGIAFHSLPVTRFFKLDVRFDAEDDERVLLENADPVREMCKVELDHDEMTILSILQKDLTVAPEPFAAITNDRFSYKQAFKIINNLQEKGVIRRVAGIVNHRKLGLVANAMFVAQVHEHRIVELGRNLAHLGLVSHCYERRTFEGWHYNLFAMMHGRDMNDVQMVVTDFTDANGLADFQLLSTVRELKKQPVRYDIG